MENRQIQDVIRNIENNIAKCSILKGVLEAKKLATLLIIIGITTKVIAMKRLG